MPMFSYTHTLQPLQKYTVFPKVGGHLNISPICGFSPDQCHKVVSMQLFGMSFGNDSFHILELKSLTLFQHYSVPLHKTRPMFDVELA